jgi:penicillin V acylase-like amidase (Ntn superfamily)
MNTNAQKKFNPLIILIGILLLFNYSLVYPCTTFVLKNDRNLLFGRNLDWHIGTGLLITNQRNIEKIALVDSAENPIKWISKYGSITFNQVGRDLPYGGMNEAGLVVEHMSLPKTKYPAKDDRQSIQACQWIQYQLDNCATVEDVINSDKILRIVDDISLFHFLICDRLGNAAVIEFLNGTMIVKAGEQLPLTALANSTYEESITSFVTKANTAYDRSLYNFCTASNMIENYTSNKVSDDIAYSFDILKSVAQGYSTKWSIVYDIKNLKVYFKIFETPTLIETQIIFLKEEGSAETKIIDLTEFDFKCSSPSLVMDLEIDKEGVVNSYFTEYTTDINKKYISKAFDYFWRFGVPINISDEELNYLAKYPENFNCINK